MPDKKEPHAVADTFSNSIYTDLKCVYLTVYLTIFTHLDSIRFLYIVKEEGRDYFFKCHRMLIREVWLPSTCLQVVRQRHIKSKMILMSLLGIATHSRNNVAII